VCFHKLGGLPSISNSGVIFGHMVDVSFFHPLGVEVGFNATSLVFVTTLYFQNMPWPIIRNIVRFFSLCIMITPLTF